MDTLDDVDIDDDVETELDVDTLKKERKIITSYSWSFLHLLKSCLNDNKIYSVFTSYSWVLKSSITSPSWQKKILCYLEEVDTLDDVEMDDDVDTELEVETLKKKNRLPLYSKQ